MCFRFSRPIALPGPSHFVRISLALGLAGCGTFKVRDLNQSEVGRVRSVAIASFAVQQPQSKTLSYDLGKGQLGAAHGADGGGGADVEAAGFVLTPGRYVGSDYIEEDDEVFEEKMKRLTAELVGQFKESRELEDRIQKNLKSIGFEV